MRPFSITVTVLLLTLSPFSLSSVPPAPRLPVEHFTRWDEVYGPQISPDGKHIAYLTGTFGRSIIAVLTVADRRPVGGVRCPEGLEVFEFEWVSDTRIVYELAERQPNSSFPVATGQLLAIDFDGKRQQVIYGYRAGEEKYGTRMRSKESSFASPEIVSTLRSDDGNILIAEHPWKRGNSFYIYDREARPMLTRLNTFSGHKEELGQIPLADASPLVDQSDHVRFAVGTDASGVLSVSWKPDPGAPWQAFELPGFREESVFPQIFSEDDASVYFIGVAEGEATSAFYTLDLQTRAVRKIHGFEGTDTTNLVLDLSGRKVVGTLTETDKPVFHWLVEDDRTVRIHRALSKAFEGQTISIGGVTRDGTLAIVETSSDVNPGDYYLFDTRTMKAEFLYAASSWIDPSLMRPRTAFSFRSRDDVELHGYITLPAGPGPHPMVVIPHGGPHGVRDSWAYDPEVQLLANRGYAVLQVNFRGSGGYGEPFMESGFREWGGKIQDDIADATRWAIDHKHAQAGRICIYGGSFGGYSALMGAAREPSLYRCAIGLAGIYDLELMYSSADIPETKSGRRYLEKAIGTDKEELRRFSPVYLAAKIEAPVLLIHGTQDWRADFSQAKRMKAALESAHKPLEWMKLGNEGHGVYDQETRREMYERILAFLGKHLPVEPSGAQ